MTHIHRYKLPIRHRHPNALRHLAWTIAILLAVYGLWWSVTSARAHYLLVTEAEARIAKAEADRQEVHDVLKGKLSMIDWDGVSKYAVIERVTWEVR